MKWMSMSASLAGSLMILEMVGVSKSTRTPLMLLVDPALKLRAPVLGVTVDLSHRDNS